MRTRLGWLLIAQVVIPFLVLLLTLPALARPDDIRDVVIAEIAWMGTNLSTTIRNAHLYEGDTINTNFSHRSSEA